MHACGCGGGAELSDDEDNFHPNIDNNLMIRLQREKRQQREKEEAEKREKLAKEGTIQAKEELDRLERQKKLHVGNMCHDKFNSKHEKSSASSSANPTAAVDNKVKVKATDEASFTDGYEEFMAANKEILLEYAAIDEEDEKSEQYVLAHTQLLSEHATGFYLLHCINLQVPPLPLRTPPLSPPRSAAQSAPERRVPQSVSEGSERAGHGPAVCWACLPGRPSPTLRLPMTHRPPSDSPCNSASLASHDTALVGTSPIHRRRRARRAR